MIDPSIQDLAARFIQYAKAQKGLRQTPAGYITWQQYIKQIGLSAIQEQQKSGLTEKSRTVLAALCDLDLPPRYITTEMSLAWQKTKVPKLNWNTPYALPGYVLFPPCPMKERPPEYFAGEWFIQALMIIYRPDGLQVFTHDVTFDTQASLFRVAFHEMLVRPDVDYNDSSCNDQARAIALLAINSWLIHAHEPKLIEQEPAQLRGGFGVKRQARSPLAPTWIGRNFKVRRESSPSPGQETDIKVRPHWRSGHWHTVRHGKGREQERLQWYRPVYVNTDTAA